MGPFFDFFGCFVVFCNKFYWFVDIEIRNRGQFYFYSLFDLQIKLRKSKIAETFLMDSSCGHHVVAIYCFMRLESGEFRDVLDLIIVPALFKVG